MSDPTAPVEGATASEGTETTSGTDYAPVMDRLSELAGSVGELQQGFQQFQQANQPPPAEEPDPWAALFGEPDPDPNAQVEPQPPQMDPQALQTAIQHAISQSNAPLLERLQHFEMQQATQQLYQRIPQLADKPENQEIRQATAQRVQQSLATYPPHVAQLLQNDPNYIATIFEAAEAKNAAGAQVPAGGEVPTLEAAGGAHPGGNGEQANPIDQIYASRQQEIPKGFR